MDASLEIFNQLFGKINSVQNPMRLFHM